jgi:hypothetical protein
MINEDFLPVIEKKLSKIIRDMQSPKANTAKALHELVLWLRGDRSIDQHRLFWAFIKYLYENIGNESENLQNFKDRLFVNANLVKVIYKSKEKVLLQPESIAFFNCSQKRFDQIFNEVKEFANENLNINFDDFYQYYQQGEHLV